ncbi:MAG: hypothetical protein GY730_10325 [bacterium]|nr:hypothetical protein [bacterium]
MAKKAVVFIPGYKGSFLRNSSKRVWVTTQEILFGTKTLELVPHKNRPQDKNSLTEDGVIDRIKVIPGIYSKNVYYPWLEKLKAMLPKDHALYIFSYDWRYGIYDNINLFHQFIQNLLGEGITDIKAIAHSLGGNILSYYLRYGNQKPNKAIENWEGTAFIKKAVFGATPFKGTLKPLLDIHTGEKVVINKHLLNKKAVRTFPLAYQILPEHTWNALINMDTGDPIYLYSADNWKKYKIGYFNDDHSRILSESVFYPFIKENLENGQALSRCLLRNLKTKPPENFKMINIRSGSLDTYTRLFWKAKDGDYKLIHTKKNLNKYSYKKDLFSDGDGTVTLESAKTPPAYMNNCNEFMVDGEHTYLFSNQKAQNIIFDFLL